LFNIRSTGFVGMNNVWRWCR